MADMQTLKNDIAFMRALAEEGRTTPLLGGSIMVVAGLIFGLASLGAYAVQSGIVAVGGWIHLPLWLGAAAVFFIALMVIKGRLRGRPGVQSPGNRAMRSAWQGVGLAIVVWLWIALMVAAQRTHNFEIFGLFPSVALAFYGAAWVLAARMSERGWMLGAAAVSFLMSVAVAAVVGRPELYLVYAAALVFTAVVPGVILVRQAPADVI